MSKTTKRLLVSAIVCLVVGGALNTGLINARGIDALYAILPMGAVFAGLFLIVKVLEKEGAEQDEEQLPPKADAANSAPAIAPAGAAVPEQQPVGAKSIAG